MLGCNKKRGLFRSTCLNFLNPFSPCIEYKFTIRHSSTSGNLQHSLSSSLNIESNILIHSNFSIAMIGLVRMMDCIAGCCVQGESEPFYWIINMAKMVWAVLKYWASEAQNQSNCLPICWIHQIYKHIAYRCLVLFKLTKEKLKF